jgi:hypothetical protein
MKGARFRGRLFFWAKHVKERLPGTRTHYQAFERKSAKPAPIALLDQVEQNDNDARHA